MRRLIALSALVVLATAANGAPPPSTCGSWVSQTDGSDWRMCADSRGTVFCQYKSGGKIRLMVCP